MKRINRVIISLSLFLLFPFTSYCGHVVEFCGEQIPMDNDFVANRLMNVIRKQIPNVNLPELRARARLYFPLVESYLKKAGLPLDLKYVAIVESGFLSNAQSRVGARGFWQIMPLTAQGYGMMIGDPVDERDDIHKSTSVACKLLRDNYNYIKKNAKVASWVLTCAAYNFGIGNIAKRVHAQGTDYFSMQLNDETAVYVYKIIAVKQLFEYPELYLSKFGYNVFSNSSKRRGDGSFSGNDDDAVFHSVGLSKDKKRKPTDTTFYVSAHIKPDKKFEEGDFVNIILDEDMKTSKGVVYKGSSIAPLGWVVDDRIVVDLGYGTDVLLYDVDMIRGVALSTVQVKGKKGIPVLLKVVVPI